MSSPWSWPALQGGRQSTAISQRVLRYERGVWGKAHGADSDFRWIARSRDLDPEIHREIWLGPEDAPADAFAWRALGERFCAVHLYPSTATDAAGRGGFVEKQLLVWTTDRFPALGALLLLPRVGSWSGDDRWTSRHDHRWRERDFHFLLGPADTPPVEVTEAALEGAIGRGLEYLREKVGRDPLLRLYTELAAGVRPALLPELSEPLVPAALAALLLPLPGEAFHGLSLAGWIPSQRWSPDLGRCWDVITLGRSQEVPEPRPTVEEDSEARAQAERWVQALLEDDPDRIASAHPGAGAAGLDRHLDFESETLPPTFPAEAFAGFAGLGPDDSLGDGGGTSTAWPGPGLRIGHLPRPPSPSSPILDEVFEFADRVDRRWLDPAAFAERVRSLPHLRHDAAQLIERWAEVVDENRPWFADEHQWHAKADLLRALSTVLATTRSRASRTELSRAGKRWLAEWDQALRSTSRFPCGGSNE